MLARANDEDFPKPEHRDVVIIETEQTSMPDRLQSWQKPTVNIWIGQAKRTAGMAEPSPQWSDAEPTEWEQ